MLTKTQPSVRKQEARAATRDKKTTHDNKQGNKMTLTDLDAYRPIPEIRYAKSLSNAQIAQILVRGSECIADQASLVRVLATLSAVRNLRTELASYLNQESILAEVQELLKLIGALIDLSEEARVDVEFDD